MRLEGRVSVAVALLVMLLASPAAAKERETEDARRGGESPILEDDSRSPMIVMFAETSRAELTADVVETTEAQLADIGVELTVRWVDALPSPQEAEQRIDLEPDDGSRVIAAFWIDFSNDAEVVLCIPESRGWRLLERGAGQGGDADRSRDDIVATIVRSTATAMVSRVTGQSEGSQPVGSYSIEAIGAGRESTETSASVVFSARTPRESASRPVEAFELMSAYFANAWGDRGSWLQGARVGLDVKLHRWLRANLSYRIAAPLEVDNEFASVTVSAHPFVIGLAARLARSSWTVQLGVSLLNDPQTWEVEPRLDNVEAETDTFRWLTAISPGALVAWSPHRRVGLFLAVSADIYLNERPLVVETLDGEAKILDPLPVKPFFQIGASVALF